MPGRSRRPQGGGGIHIEHFLKGLVTNRAATSVPFRFTQMGQAIQYMDALIDGLNVEITPANTLARRPGFPQFCSVALSGAETAQGYTSAILNSTLYDLLSTSVNVYNFNSSSLTSIYTKGTTAQSFFQQVGNLLYFSDGTANLKWDGTNVTNAGVAAPTSAPTIPNLNLYDSVGGTQTVHAWVPGASYTNGTASPINFFVLAPTGEIQWVVVPAGATLKSQTSAPNWSTSYGTVGALTNDGTVTWINCGPIGTWKASTGSPTYFNSAFTTTAAQAAGPKSAGTAAGSGSNTANWVVSGTGASFSASGAFGHTNTVLFTNFGLSVPTGATIIGVQFTVQKKCSYSPSVWDSNIQLVKAGTPTGTNQAVNTQHWAQGSYQTYTYGSNNNLWGTSLAVSDVTASNFGLALQAGISGSSAFTGNVQGVTCTVYYTLSGSTGLTSTYTSTVILDSNGNLQRVKTLGTTGTSVPTWTATIGGSTTDNAGGGTMVWECLGSGNQLPCLFSRTYAYGWRTQSAHLSTLSPLLVVQAPIIGPNVNLQGASSADTQVHSAELYRTADGGSVLLYDTITGNDPTPNNWTIIDQALDSDLNELLIGPVALANAPPPAGATLLAYHMGRMWAVVGNLLYFSAGPDCINGDGNQAWPPANVFTFAGPINGLAPISQGLAVQTSTDFSIVLGGPGTLTFWVQPLLKNFGIQSPNCLVQDGDTIYVYTSQRQLFAISAEGGKDEVGFAVAPTLAANFSPASSYLTLHRSGQDQGLFISDGSAKIMRYNLTAGSWDPLAQPVSGIGAIGSVDTVIGTRTLLSNIGTAIVGRSTATFADNGSAFSAYGVVGSLPLSQGGGDAAKLDTIVLVSAAVGTALTVGVLRNEISGSFTNIPLSKQDPPLLAASSTINMNCYDWMGVQTALANVIRHLQIKITMPATDTVKNEIFGVHLVPIEGD